MARRGEHSQEQIKEMVLQAAEKLVAKEGYAGLKVRKIAMEVGYTVGSIYMVFDNLDDLITHIKSRTLDCLILELSKVSNNISPIEQLTALSQTYLAFAHQNFNSWSIIFEHNSDLNSLNTANKTYALPDWYQKKIVLVFKRIEELFQKIAPTINTKEHSIAARALWSGIHGVCILSLTGKLNIVGIKDVEQTLTLLTKSFITGWQTEMVVS